MADPATLPPASLLLGAWFGAALLIGAKRLSEYRGIVASHGGDLIAWYGTNSELCDEISLTASTFVYARLSVMALSTFCIKYRVGYGLLLPVLAVLFGK
jgi:hypothetical protein